VACDERFERCGAWAGGCNGADWLGRLADDESERVTAEVGVVEEDPDEPAERAPDGAFVEPLVDFAAAAVVAGRDSSTPNRPVAAVAPTKLQRVSRETRLRPRSRWRGVVMVLIKPRQR